MRQTLLGLAATVCVVPALAFAADPAPSSSFQYCSSENRCPFGFKTNKTGTKIKQISAYNKCAEVPVPGGYPKIPVNDEGKFSKSGTVTDAIGQELTFTIKGKFQMAGIEQPAPADGKKKGGAKRGA